MLYLIGWFFLIFIYPIVTSHSQSKERHSFFKTFLWFSGGGSMEFSKYLGKKILWVGIKIFQICLWGNHPPPPKNMTSLSLKNSMKEMYTPCKAMMCFSYQIFLPLKSRSLELWASDTYFPNYHAVGGVEVSK